jgi:hypothetical protein
MPYVAAQDPYKIGNSSSDPSKSMVLIAAADADLTGNYPKALRVYSAAGCVVRVTPAKNADSATVDLTYPAGVFTEPLCVRRVWTTGTTGTPVIHGYQDN